MTTLTKKQAWAHIAQAFEKAAATGEYDRITNNGLCWAVLALYLVGWNETVAIDKATYQAMEVDLDSVKPVIDGADFLEGVIGHDPDYFWWPQRTPESSAYRAVLAQLLSETSED